MTKWSNKTAPKTGPVRSYDRACTRDIHTASSSKLLTPRDIHTPANSSLQKSKPVAPRTPKPLEPNSLRWAGPTPVPLRRFHLVPKHLSNGGTGAALCTVEEGATQGVTGWLEGYDIGYGLPLRSFAFANSRLFDPVIFWIDCLNRLFEQVIWTGYSTIL